MPRWSINEGSNRDTTTPGPGGKPPKIDAAGVLESSLGLHLDMQDLIKSDKASTLMEWGLKGIIRPPKALR